MLRPHAGAIISTPCSIRRIVALITRSGGAWCRSCVLTFPMSGAPSIFARAFFMLTTESKLNAVPRILFSSSKISEVSPQI